MHSVQIIHSLQAELFGEDCAFQQFTCGHDRLYIGCRRQDYDFTIDRPHHTRHLPHLPRDELHLAKSLCKQTSGMQPHANLHTRHTHTHTIPTHIPTCYIALLLAKTNSLNWIPYPNTSQPPQAHDSLFRMAE